MPTIAGFMQLLPPGFNGERYRSTDGTVFSPTEGSGRSKVGNMTIEWKERDVFVVPPWYPVSHETEKGAVLFSFRIARRRRDWASGGKSHFSPAQQNGAEMNLPTPNL